MSTQINVAIHASGARERLGLVKASDGRLWRNDGARYLPDGQEEAEQYYLDQMTSEAKPGEMMGMVKLLLGGRVGMDLALANNPDHLNLRNGRYDWATRELLPHDPAYFDTYIVPHYLNPGATCPLIDATLERAIPDPAVRALLWEWWGYSLVPGNRYKKALILVGPKDAGKTVFIHTWKHLLGADNVSAVSLQDIADNRFAAAGLVGKLANIADDLSANKIEHSGKVKAITGNGSIQCEEKGQKSYSAVIDAKLIFTANDLPGTGDMSDSWFDRWAIITFDQVVPKHEQDPGIWDAVTSPEELEGALVKAIAAAHRLMDRGGFDVPASVTAAVAQYQSDADSVVGWLAEECEVGNADSKVFTKRKDAYNAFSRWADSERRGVMGGPKFYKRLRDAGVIEVDGGGSHRGFRMTLKPSLPATKEPF